VKRIQAGFLASPPFLAAFPSTWSGQWQQRCSKGSLFYLRKGQGYSGVAVPDSHGVPLSAISHLNTDQFLITDITISNWMSTLRPRLNRQSLLKVDPERAFIPALKNRDWAQSKGQTQQLP